MSIIIRLQNLPWAADSGDIRRFFVGLSIPEGGVHIVGGEMGDAFIAFSTDEDARLAMAKDGGKIHEMQIKLLLSSRTEMGRVIERARQQNLAHQTATVVPPLQPPPFPIIQQLQQPLRTATPPENDRRSRRSPTPPRRRSRSRERDSRDRRRSPDSRRSSSKRERSRSPSRSSRSSTRDSDRRTDRSRREDRRYSNEDASKYNLDRHSDRNRYSDSDHVNNRSQPFPEPSQNSSNPFYNYQDSSIKSLNSHSLSTELSSNIPKDFPSANVSNISNFSYGNSSNLNTTKDYPYYNVSEKMALPQANVFGLDKNTLSLMHNQAPSVMPNPYVQQTNLQMSTNKSGPSEKTQELTVSANPPQERRRKSRFEPEPEKKSRFEPEIKSQFEPDQGAPLRPPFFQMPEVLQKLGVHLNMQNISVEEKRDTGNFMPEKQIASQSFMQEKQIVPLSFLQEKQFASQNFMQEKQFAAQTFMQEKQTAPQSFLQEKQFASQNFMPEKQLASQSFMQEKLTGSQSFMQGKPMVPQNYMQEKQIGPPSYMQEKQTGSQGFMQENQMRLPRFTQESQMGSQNFIERKQMEPPSFMQGKQIESPSYMQGKPIGHPSFMQENQRRPPNFMQEKPMEPSSFMQGNQMEPPGFMQEKQMRSSNLMQEKQMEPQNFMQETQKRLQSFVLDKQITSQSFMQEKQMGSQHFMQEKQIAPQRFMQEKPLEREHFMPDQQIASQSFMREKQIVSQNFMQEKQIGSQNFLKDKQTTSQNYFQNQKSVPSNYRSEKQETPHNYLLEKPVASNNYKSDRQENYKSDRSENYRSDRLENYRSDRSENYRPDRSENYKSNRSENNKSDRSESYKSGRSESYKSGRSESYKSDRSENYKSDRSETYKSDKSDNYKSNRSENYKSDKSIAPRNSKLDKPTQNLHSDYVRKNQVSQQSHTQEKQSKTSQISGNRDNWSQSKTITNDKKGNTTMSDQDLQKEKVSSSASKHKTVPMDIDLSEESQKTNSNTDSKNSISKPVIETTETKLPSKSNKEDKITSSAKSNTIADGSSKRISTLAVEVRNLPHDVGVEDFFNLFKNITLSHHGVCIQIHNQKPEKAFLRFSNIRETEQVIKTQPHSIRNSQLEIIPCPVSVFDTAYEAYSVSKSRPKAKSREEDLILQLKGLPFQCTEHDIVRFFDGLRILDIFVETLPDGRCSGTGFVEFASIKDSKKALTFNGNTIGHRYININVSCKEALESYRREMDKPSGKQSRGVGPQRRPQSPPRKERFVEPPDLIDHPADDIRNGQNTVPPIDNPPAPVTLVRGNFCIAIRGLPKSVTNVNLGNFFREMDVCPLAIHIIVDIDGPTGDAYVEVNTQNEIEIAVSHGGELFNNCPIDIHTIPMEELDELIGRPPPPHASRPPPPNAPGQPLLRTPLINHDRPPRRPLLPRGPPSSGEVFPERPPLNFAPNERMRGSGPMHPARPRMSRMRAPFERPARPPFGRMRGPRPDEPRDRDNQVQGFGAPGCVVSINNLHFSAGLEELLGFFRDYRISKDNIIRRFNENQQPTGEARVCFENPREARRAVQELNTKPIMGRSLHLAIL